MRIKLLAVTLIWFFVFGSDAFGQKESYIWYFGDSAGVDFNSGVPVVLNNGAMIQREGCSSIADANGNLLFYTNGVNVWNNMHAVMPNGNSLKGHSSTTQSALIAKSPGSSFLYYIFTAPEATLGDSLYYSIVDMTLNGGLGDVTVKNAGLGAPASEKLAGVKHANGTDIWIVAHGDADNYLAFLLTAAGVQAPVISSTGAVVTGNVNKVGQLKFSPEGSKAAAAFFFTPLDFCEFYDFDNATGIFSNVITTPPFPNAYGIEFSPDGSKVYCSSVSSLSLCQYDLNAGSVAAILASKTDINSTIIQRGSLQLAPDGKIYVAAEGRKYLAAINNPDMAGIACNFTDSVLYLNGKTCKLGLPNFISSYFLPTGIITNISQENQLIVSPNPATDKITISFPATAKENVSIKIYSVTGEKVFSDENKTTGTAFYKIIDVNKFSNGIYFLSVQTDEGMVTKKMVVNH